MEIFKTEDEIATRTCEHLRDGEWKKQGRLKAPGGMILLDVTDTEHDQILNVSDQLDPMGLRGYRAKLVLDDPTEHDPEHLDLVFIPSHGQVIRHQDRYYLVKLVLQSTNYSIAVFAIRIAHDAVRALARGLI